MNQLEAELIKNDNLEEKNIELERSNKILSDTLEEFKIIIKDLKERNKSLESNTDLM
jgi:hypothetical protein